MSLRSWYYLEVVLLPGEEFYRKLAPAWEIHDIDREHSLPWRDIEIGKTSPVVASYLAAIELYPGSPQRHQQAVCRSEDKESCLICVDWLELRALALIGLAGGGAPKKENQQHEVRARSHF